MRQTSCASGAKRSQPRLHMRRASDTCESAKPSDQLTALRWLASRLRVRRATPPRRRRGRAGAGRMAPGREVEGWRGEGVERWRGGESGEVEGESGGASQEEGGVLAGRRVRWPGGVCAGRAARLAHEGGGGEGEARRPEGRGERAARLPLEEPRPEAQHPVGAEGVVSGGARAEEGGAPLLREGGSLRVPVVRQRVRGQDGLRRGAAFEHGEQLCVPPRGEPAAEEEEPRARVCGRASRGLQELGAGRAGLLCESTWR